MNSLPIRQNHCPPKRGNFIPKALGEGAQLADLVRGNESRTISFLQHSRQDRRVPARSPQLASGGG